MNAIVRISVTAAILLSSIRAQDTAAPAVSAPRPPFCSLVYLPDLDWTESESKQAVTLIAQLKPGLVVSLAACPFAQAIRDLDCKPMVLDRSLRREHGKECGIHAIPLAAYADTSSLHSFGGSQSGTPSLVWLSAESVKKPFNGPRVDEGELCSLANMQVRHQLAERQGEVIFLVDPSLPTPVESDWILPWKNAQYEQAKSAITLFACIRPETLQAELPAIDGLAPRVPLVHWIHTETKGMDWETLPIDGGPAIHHSSSTCTESPGGAKNTVIGFPKAPAAKLDVPRWMDDYINNNPALGSGENNKQGNVMRRFGWSDYGVTRDSFQVLRSSEKQAADEKPVSPIFEKGAVRSPGNLFSISVAQLDEKGLVAEGDDGLNVYLDDLRGNKSRLLYYAGLYSAWPSAATWFTDRYVITSGTSHIYLDKPEDSDPSPRIYPQTFHLFDLQTGRSFVANGAPEPARETGPTEKIFFPNDSYSDTQRWQTLWKAVEAGYHAKPEAPPFTVEEVAAIAKLPTEPGLKWKDLGIWPPPEVWQIVHEKEDQDYIPGETKVNSGDAYLNCIQSADGLRHYQITIAGYHYSHEFVERPPIADVVAHADLLTAGGGRLPKVETISRMGDRKQHLAMAGTYQKPGGGNSENGKWMLLIDLLNHRSWSAHW